MMKSNHELDSNEDLVLILNSFSFEYKNVEYSVQSEDMIKYHRLEIRYYFS